VKPGIKTSEIRGASRDALSSPLWRERQGIRPKAELAILAHNQHSSWVLSYFGAVRCKITFMSDHCGYPQEIWQKCHASNGMLDHEEFLVVASSGRQLCLPYALRGLSRLEKRQGLRPGLAFSRVEEDRCGKGHSMN
jgi:hypothetical protein